MRPAIDPRNLRRQSTRSKVTRTIVRAAFWMAVAIVVALLFVHVFDPAVDLTHYQLPTL